MARVREEFLTGELTLGCWFECATGRYQLRAVEHRVTITDEGERDRHAKLTLYRDPVERERVSVKVETS